MDLGFARFDAGGVRLFNPPMKPKPTRWIREIRATRMTISLNLWLKKIAGTGFDLEAGSATT
ncbi:maltoporin [Klebsiella pneumoniae]|uniref:Maltoporin n=1 Tax=Klebsiella pneumoniae TaxID=573 RepID=A0A447RPJ4_KLEPN|nr:maltoporin [Klebsiella pneumoniae]